MGTPGVHEIFPIAGAEYFLQFIEDAGAFSSDLSDSHRLPRHASLCGVVSTRSKPVKGTTLDHPGDSVLPLKVRTDQAVTSVEKWWGKCQS